MITAVQMFVDMDPNARFELRQRNPGAWSLAIFTDASSHQYNIYLTDAQLDALRVLIGQEQQAVADATAYVTVTTDAAGR